MKILLIIPAYNEEDNILKTCKKVDEFNKKAENKVDYVVINDGSKDNTLKLLQENHINHINLIRNLGIGGAVQTGYKYAEQNGYDIAIQFDGDGQHNIDYVPKLCKLIEENKADLVIGSRYIKNEESHFQSTFMRRLGALIIKFLIAVCCRKIITDPTSGFRAANKDVIKIFAKEYPKDYPEPESTVSLLVNGYRVEETSVDMSARERRNIFN